MKVMLTLDDGQSLTAEVHDGPVMYDVVRDERRPVTQADVDRWLQMEASFSKVAIAVKEYRERPLGG